MGPRIAVRVVQQLSLLAQNFTTSVWMTGIPRAEGVRSALLHLGACFGGGGWASRQAEVFCCSVMLLNGLGSNQSSLPQVEGNGWLPWKCAVSWLECLFKQTRAQKWERMVSPADRNEARAVTGGGRERRKWNINEDTKHCTYTESSMMFLLICSCSDSWSLKF